jgi:aromatic ring-cleaving dioxygenase
VPQFQSVVPRLRLNRESLDTLVHPLTDGMVDDHGVLSALISPRGPFVNPICPETEAPIP